MRRSTVLTAFALAAGASAGAAAAQTDAGGRYGPAVPPQSAAPIAYAPAPSAPAAVARYGRVLAWPGKVAIVRAPAAAYVQQGYAQQAYAQQGYGAPAGGVPAVDPARSWRRGPTAPVPSNASYAMDRAPPTASTAPSPPALAGAPAQGWRPVFAARGPAPVQSAALPTSIYAAPAAQPAATLARAAPPPQGQPAYRRYGYDPTQDHSVRFYSVHRPFGMNPDPAPIPPQFFTATADLSEPPGPLPVNHTTAANRAAAVNTADAGGQ